MKLLSNLLSFLLPICLFGPVLMVIDTSQGLVQSDSVSPNRPYYGALLMTMAIFSFFWTTARHTKEIDLLRKELEALKAGES